MEHGLTVEIERNAPVAMHPFLNFFRGFEDVPPVRNLFKEKTEDVLRSLRVEFFSFRFGYMGTSDEDGHILISSRHLRDSDFRTLYLDIVHELCHVKQFQDGRELFTARLHYVDNPTEIEAYQITVDEGRRIGMTTKQLVDYLKVEWVDEKDHRRLVRRMGLERTAAHRRRKKARRLP